MHLNRSEARPFTSTRTFGVEIEAVGNGLSYSQVAQAISDAGIPCYAEDYGHDAPRNWKVVKDGSLSYGGFEVVSPILRGTEGIEQVRKVAEALRNAGATIDSRCGLHVHVGAQGLSGADLMNVLRRYEAHITDIQSVLIPFRREGAHGARWCRSVAGLVSRFSSLPNTATCEDVCAVAGSGGRYYTVNLLAYLRHGTLEFRQHSGTLDATKIANWIMFCVNFVEQSRMTVFEIPATPAPVPSVAPAVVAPAATPRVRANALSVTYDRLQALLETASYGAPATVEQIAQALEIAEASVPAYVSNFRGARRNITVNQRRGRGYYINFTATQTPAANPLPAPSVAPVPTVRTITAPIDYGPFATLPLAVQSYFCEQASIT